MADDEKLNSVYTVPIVKAKGESVDIDIAELNDKDYRQVVSIGLKAAINTGAGWTKVTSKTYPDAAELKAAASKLAREKAASLIAGTFKWGRAAAKAATEVPYKVMVEGRRLAKAAVKELIVASGGRVTHYKQSAITQAANELLAAPEGMAYLLEAAKAVGFTYADGIWSEAERPKVAVPKGFKLPEADAELKAKAESKAKVPAGVLSAAKAGTVVSRAKH